jgi:hypothetical protein
MMDNRSYDACDDGKKGNKGRKGELPKSNRNIITRQYFDTFFGPAGFVT